MPPWATRSTSSPASEVPSRVARMCGRYASSRRPEDLVDEFDIVESRIQDALEADYNVAPTKEVYAVVERPPRQPDGSKDSLEPPQRQLRVLTWGLVPSWAKE